ncbi:bifunctional hydroxymethylpyrimidine kinase/phosphomethylpyrimidine kinase [Halomarina litorea]|uniref:bifunctional hydroxymethylpyrimidine kinase/phosphomethylpyrimidine kinase n=1 Tax=Halomarina litorea TaxID=2961595 RepID=UPI0020C3D38A|nr:bifunctional hydroxymethylpyrimidine kinase/phosphomethylpyrimidine kinase [Halomarina sp. BCD28]
MRQPAPVSRPVVLTVAGSDSGGGAGIQADLKTIEAGGGFGTSVVTAVTAQHTRGVESSFVLPLDEIEAQLDAVLGDFDVRAVKTGMLATGEVVEAVTDRARELDAPLVVDPVMVATSGDRLLAEAAERAYEELVGEATVVTPNADEAAVLTGVDVEDESSAREAGEALREMGAEYALVKGGHVDSGDEVIDTLVGPEGRETFTHARVDTDATHGSGCTLSSAIATHLAHDEAPAAAVGDATWFMERAVRYHHDVGQGPGAVHHLVALRERADRQPTQEAVEELVRAFVDADVGPLVPEVGTNVVGAGAYAESGDEVVAVEGRIARTLSGVEPTRGTRFGASSHVGQFLLGAREVDPELRFAVNLRFDDRVERALDGVPWPVATADGGSEGDEADEEEGERGEFTAARRTLTAASRTPRAVVNPARVGYEPTTLVLAREADVLRERTLTLLDRLEEN